MSYRSVASADIQLPQIPPVFPPSANSRRSSCEESVCISRENNSVCSQPALPVTRDASNTSHPHHDVDSTSKQLRPRIVAFR